MLDLFPQQRSPGHHVSSALHRIMATLHPDRFKDDPPDQTRMNLGNALEKAIVGAFARAYPDHFVIPGELWHDGYLGTPDLWYLGSSDRRDPVAREFGRERATVEIKLTWASSRRAEDIEDVWFWRYWQQLRAYGFMAQMVRGILIIVFVNGDYRNSPPVGLMWEDKWTPEELLETWQMVQSYTTPETGSRKSKNRSPQLRSRPSTVEESLDSLASRRRTRRGTR